MIPPIPSRRTVLRTGAWSLPAVAVAASAPAFAASPGMEPGSPCAPEVYRVDWSDQPSLTYVPATGAFTGVANQFAGPVLSGIMAVCVTDPSKVVMVEAVSTEARVDNQPPLTLTADRNLRLLAENGPDGPGVFLGVSHSYPEGVELARSISQSVRFTIASPTQPLRIWIGAHGLNGRRQVPADLTRADLATHRDGGASRLEFNRKFTAMKDSGGKQLLSPGVVADITAWNASSWRISNDPAIGGDAAVTGGESYAGGWLKVERTLNSTEPRGFEVTLFADRPVERGRDEVFLADIYFELPC